MIKSDDVKQFSGKTVLHYTAYDILPGAAKSAYNIHKAFEKHGADSKMIVLQKSSEDDSVVEAGKGFVYQLQQTADRVTKLIKQNKKRKRVFNSNKRMHIRTSTLFPDVKSSVDAIFIYWISNYLNTQLQEKVFNHYNCPVVWVLMDMEPITGGCHQSMMCNRYKESCGKCHILGSRQEVDLSRKTMRSKQRVNSHRKVTYVAPTMGLYRNVTESTLAGNCRVEHIPLAVETEIYRPVSMKSAREVINIDQSRIVLCFGANDIQSVYKGKGYLEEALHVLNRSMVQKGKAEVNDRIVLLLAGGNRGEAFNDIPYEVIYLGHCRDTRTMALMFQSSDLFVCPSVYDGGPVMIAEAMMCGTPVVAFDSGGASDLIQSKVNGYIAEYKNAEDFAAGIEHIVDQSGNPEIRRRARLAAENMNTPEIVAGKYCELLKSIIDSDCNS